jgi:hypothetical protein
MIPLQKIKIYVTKLKIQQEQGEPLPQYTASFLEKQPTPKHRNTISKHENLNSVGLLLTSSSPEEVITLVNGNMSRPGHFPGGAPMRRYNFPVQSIAASEF